jgi:hypothetical protein
MELETKLDKNTQHYRADHNKFRGVRQEYTQVRNRLEQIDADLIVLKNYITQIDHRPAR